MVETAVDSALGHARGHAPSYEEQHWRTGKAFDVLELPSRRTIDHLQISSITNMKGSPGQ